MKPSKLIFFIGAYLFLVSCKDCEPAITLDEIPLGCWINAREEQSHSDTLIYRPCDFQDEWPASHYRNMFVLEEQGQGSYMILHPADAHYMLDCTWDYDAEEKLLTFSFTQFTDAATYKVIRIENDKIILTYF